MVPHLLCMKWLFQQQRVLQYCTAKKRLSYCSSDKSDSVIKGFFHTELHCTVHYSVYESVRGIMMCGFGTVRTVVTTTVLYTVLSEYSLVSQSWLSSISVYCTVIVVVKSAYSSITAMRNVRYVWYLTLLEHFTMDIVCIKHHPTLYIDRLQYIKERSTLHQCRAIVWKRLDGMDDPFSICFITLD